MAGLSTDSRTQQPRHNWRNAAVVAAVVVVLAVIATLAVAYLVRGGDSDPVAKPAAAITSPAAPSAPASQAGPSASPSPNATMSATAPWSHLGVAASPDDIRHKMLDTLPAGNPIRIDAQWRGGTETLGPRGEFGWSVAQAAQTQRPMLAIITYAPKQYAAKVVNDCQDGDICGSSNSTAAIAAYREFAVKATDTCVQAYRGNQSQCAMELWNEPNIEPFWQPGTDPGTYAALASQASCAIKAKYPGVIVLLGGLSPSGSGGGNLTPADFLEQMYATLDRQGTPAAGRCWNAIATHPYDGIGQTLAVYDVMQAHGDGAKKIWATEFGAKNLDGQPPFDNTTAKDYVQKLIELWKAQPWAGPMFVYTWWDDPAEGVHGFCARDAIPCTAHPLFDLLRA